MTLFSEHFNDNDNLTMLAASFIADKGSEGATWKEMVDFYFSKNQLTQTERLELHELINKGENLLQLDNGIKIRKLISSLNFDDTFHIDNNGIYILFSGLSSLIDFIELKQARRNSIEARRYSTYAILLSILSLIASVVFGCFQMNSSTKLDSKQFESIGDFNKALKDSFYIGIKEIQFKLDSISHQLLKESEKMPSK